MSSEIREIAERIRKEFEEKRIPEETLFWLYSQYNRGVNGNIFVAEAKKIFPNLNCGLSSIYLRKMLGGELVQGYYDGYNHTFLMLGGRVVDITADQYGGSKVYIGELKFPWTRK